MPQLLTKSQSLRQWTRRKTVFRIGSGMYVCDKKQEAKIRGYLPSALMEMVLIAIVTIGKAPRRQDSVVRTHHLAGDRWLEIRNSECQRRIAEVHVAFSDVSFPGSTCISTATLPLPP